MVLVDDIGIFFFYISECSNQYKVNTYHYINYQDYVCTCSRPFRNNH